MNTQTETEKIFEDAALEGMTKEQLESPSRIAVIQKPVTCEACGVLIDAMGAGENIDIYVCLDCDETVVFPPGETRAACPFIFKCKLCGSSTEYDAAHERYSCINYDCKNYNKMKRPEDSDFGNFYGDPLDGYQEWLKL